MLHVDDYSTLNVTNWVIDNNNNVPTTCWELVDDVHGTCQPTSRLDSAIQPLSSLQLWMSNKVVRILCQLEVKKKKHQQQTAAHCNSDQSSAWSASDLSTAYRQHK